MKRGHARIRKPFRRPRWIPVPVPETTPDGTPKTTILIKLPSRDRAEKGVRALRVLKKLESGLHNVRYMLILDDNDPALPEYMSLVKNEPWIEVIVGQHKSKIEAWNHPVPPDYDIVIAFADDQYPVTEKWDHAVAQRMHKDYPNYDGALYFNDGFQGAKLCTSNIIGVNLEQQIGHIYHPAYDSVWCDNEYMEILQARGRLEYDEHVLFEHRHPVNGYGSYDDLYKRNEAVFFEDKAVYEKRKATVQPHAQIGFDTPPLWLSILIPSLVRRRAHLLELLAVLNKQIIGKWNLQVEILLDIDKGEATTGEKRNRLVQRAKGHYVVFIDDDDMVPDYYVDEIMQAILKDPTVDAIGLEGEMTTNGLNPKPFVHSIQHREWSESRERFYRNTNHLNPVRRAIALQAEFPHINHGEDRGYSNQLLELVKTETMIERTPMYFYRFEPNK